MNYFLDDEAQSGFVHWANSSLSETQFSQVQTEFHNIHCQADRQTLSDRGMITLTHVSVKKRAQGPLGLRNQTALFACLPV